MPTFRSLPSEISAIQYRAPGPEGSNEPGNVDELAKFLGYKDANEACLGEVRREIRPMPEGAVMHHSAHEPFSPMPLGPAPSWNEDQKLLLWVEKGQAHVEISDLDCIIAEPDGTGFYPCALEIFRGRYEPGAVAASAKLTQRQLEDEVFGAFRIEVTHHCPVFFATDDLFLHEDMVDMLLSEDGAAPALATMFARRGRAHLNVEKLVELGNRITGEIPVPDDDEDDDAWQHRPEVVREEIEGALTRSAYGWLVQASTPVKVKKYPDSTGSMVTWGYTSSKWFWADSYFGCIDQVMEWAPTVVTVENPDGSQAAEQ